MIVKHRSSISSGGGGGGGGSTLIMFVQQTIGLMIIICSIVMSERQHVESLSLSPQSTSGAGSKSGSNNQASKSIQQQQQQQQASTTAALLSGSGGYAAAAASDSNVAQIKSAAATKHLEPSAAEVSLTSGEARSSTVYSFSSPASSSASVSSNFESSDHDESVPLATINNHSRNNQPQARPPQYVDVSNLMARNANGTSPLAAAAPAASSSSSAAAASTLASGLQAKSRSGLPECATQQVCNAIFVRMNYTQRLCECSSNYNWRCSNNLDPQDGHTIELTRKFDKRIYTQIKTCEPLREVRACKSPTDWTLLALQSERSGKAHYVVVCKCPTWAQLEGPYTHNHPPYANIPGIRVYGMLCAHQTARSSAQTYATYNPALNIYPEFPWSEALNVLNTTNLLSTLDSAH